MIYLLPLASPLSHTHEHMVRAMLSECHLETSHIHKRMQLSVEDYPHKLRNDFEDQLPSFMQQNSIAPASER